MPLSTPAGKLNKMSLEPTAQLDNVEVSGDFAGTLSMYGESDGIGFSREWEEL